MSIAGNTRTRRRAPDARYPFVCACGRAAQTPVCRACTERTRRSEQRCIDCNQPSVSKRCRVCDRKVEESTHRYRGRDTRGGSTYLDQDLTDLRYALQDLGKAYHGIEHLRDRGEIARREYHEALLDPLSWLKLTQRLIQSVIDRHPHRSRE